MRRPPFDAGVGALDFSSATDADSAARDGSESSSTLILLTGLVVLMPTVARADECDAMSCTELCKADNRACATLRVSLRDWLKAFCKSDADDQAFDCFDAKTNADEDCGLLCGADSKQCEVSDAAVECNADFVNCLAACGGL